MLAAGPSVVGAQFQPFDSRIDRPDLVSKVVLGNVVIGGASAALRALINGRNVPKAFVAGAVGGAVNVSGKMISVGGGTASPIGGLLVSSVGASMVANAGQGRRPFDELFVPISFVRLRISPQAASRVKLSVNLFDIAMLADALHYSELTLDWRRSARLGTFVFTTPEEITSADGIARGVALGNVIVMTAPSRDATVTLRHEYVHVQQHLAAQEVWARPVDGFLRRRVKLLRLAPEWLELGVGELMLHTADQIVSARRGPWRRSVESEAGALTR